MKCCRRAPDAEPRRREQTSDVPCTAPTMFSSIPLFAVVSQPFKRSQLGLFQGKMKQYGNNVPHSMHKTRRTWLPNVQNKRLFSETLQKTLTIKVTTRALKTIKKVCVYALGYRGGRCVLTGIARGVQHGGLDNYLLKMKPELLGWEGMRLRVMVREKQVGLAKVATPKQEPAKVVS